MGEGKNQGLEKEPKERQAMTAPDKPGFSNEEFIKKWRRMTMSDLSLAQRRGEDAEAFWQALDRLEALIGQGKPTPGQIGLVDGDKLIEKLTIESALTRETPEGKGWIEAMNAVKYWTRLGDFSVSGQGQEERDRKVFEAGYEAFCTKHYTLDQAWDDFAAADAAKKEGGK